MFISTITLFIVAWAAYAIWSKLCDMEKKLFRMHDELSSAQKELEKQIDINQSIAYRIESNADHKLN